MCTNPDANRILSEKDMIFVLAQSPPSASSAEWGAPFEKLEEKQNIKVIFLINIQWNKKFLSLKCMYFLIFDFQNK